jgi:hypothetical protein
MEKNLERSLAGWEALNGSKLIQKSLAKDRGQAGDSPRLGRASLKERAQRADDRNKGQTIAEAKSSRQT